MKFEESLYLIKVQITKKIQWLTCTSKERPNQFQFDQVENHPNLH